MEYSKTYTPNFNDPRVIKRLKKALGFSIACISDKPKDWSQSMISKHFGQQQDKLGQFLRNTLLICTDDFYSPLAHKSKKYVLNKSGVDYLKNILEKQIDFSYDDYIKNIKITKSNPITNNRYAMYNSVDRELVKYFVEQEYGEQLRTKNFIYTDKSERYWHPVQNINREYKEFVLESYDLKHHYDIATCAPTIILELSGIYGNDLSKMKTIKDYLQNKTKIRNELAIATGLDVKSIKVLINALFCGARLGIGEHFSLSKLMNNDRSIAMFIKQNEWISSLRKEIKQCWSVIEKHEATIKYSKEEIDYSTGEITKRRRKQPMDCRNKWSIYFRYERQILNSVKRYISETNNQCFTEHDGWSSVNEININELKDIIKDQTGISINIDYKFNGNEADASLLVADAPSSSLSLSNNELVNDNNQKDSTYLISPIHTLVYDKSEIKHNVFTRKPRSDKGTGLSAKERQKQYRLRQKELKK